MGATRPRRSIWVTMWTTRSPPRPREFRSSASCREIATPAAPEVLCLQSMGRWRSSEMSASSKPGSKNADHAKYQNFLLNNGIGPLGSTRKDTSTIVRAGHNRQYSNHGGVTPEDHGRQQHTPDCGSRIRAQFEHFAQVRTDVRLRPSA